MSELGPGTGGKLRLDRPAPHVARLTIDNPAKRNALDHEILDGIAATVGNGNASTAWIARLNGCATSRSASSAKTSSGMSPMS